MCGPAAVLAVTAGVSAIGAIQQGIAASTAGSATARLREGEAARARELGAVKENAVRRKNERILGQQTVDLIKAGIAPSTGTALDLAFDSARNAELEALGVRAGAQMSAENLINTGRAARAKGRDALTGSLFGAGARLLTGVRKIQALQ